jgi:3'(2'), 5'-bisphosphate nucleotidase
VQGLTVEQNESLCQLLISAGQRALAQRQSFEVYEKGTADYVTTVDRELDHMLSVAISALFPSDTIISEENSASLLSFRNLSQRLWLIDPIDGTEEYIHQRDGYAVMVSVLENDRPMGGWIYAPARGQLYWGGPQWGVFKATPYGQAQPIDAHPPDLANRSVCPILLGYRDNERFGAGIGRALAEQLPQYLGMQQPCHATGSFGLKVLDVIQGRVGVYGYFNRRVKVWDTVGPIALAQAAGLTCCDLDGRTLNFGSAGIDLKTLTHQQMIVVGWPHYIELLLPLLRKTVNTAMARAF